MLSTRAISCASLASRKSTMRDLRVGTRASALARWQASYAIERLRTLDGAVAIHMVELSSAGDESPDVDLTRLEGTGFFTSTLERALLEEHIDIAVHSFKDLPTEMSPDLVIAAVPERGPVEDVLCTRGHLQLAELPVGARLGTSSPRRTAQLRSRRPDLEFIPLRGNVPTRLELVARGELDAVVLARAGLERLGLMNHASEIFDPTVMLPAPAQGALALQIRVGDAALGRLLKPLDHLPTRRAVDAERSVLHALHGGCSIPVGALATPRADELSLDAGVFDPAGTRAVRVRVEGRDAHELGRQVARLLLSQGAAEILGLFGREPRAVGGERQ